jgi:ribosomal protein S18 acetylase RimI-like enzyme
VERVAVRRAGDAELSTLRELWKEYASEIGRYRTAPWPWSWEDVAPRLRHGAAFLAESGGEAIGFAIASRSRADIGHVEDLYVRPAYRRRGVATALLRRLAEAFGERGVVHVALDVDAGNEAARALYAELGFELYAARLYADVGQLEERLAPGRVTS